MTALPAPVRIVAATAAGRRLAAHLAGALPDAAVVGPPPPAAAVAAAWRAGGALVLCMATGAATRLVAPHLADKRTDPPVVTLDDVGAFAVALTGGHHGANALARAVADATGATAVVTTASDGLRLPALDTLGAAAGLVLDPELADTAAVGAALVAGERVALVRDQPWPLGPLPDHVVEVPPTAAARPPCILVTDRTVAPARPAVVYRPPSLVLGIGAARGVAAAEVLHLVDRVLAAAGLSPRSVAGVATVDAKAGETGLLAAAAERSWPVSTHAAAVLARIEVPTPSETVRAAVGTPSVAEAAALVTAGPGATLVVAKHASAMATVAVARHRARGRLTLVSTGPGSEDLLPDAARHALAGAEVVVGLDQYVDRVRRFLRPGTAVRVSPIGEEVARAEAAVAEARAGRSVALLSGGDVGVYAMASPALEFAGTDVDVTTVPGVTAAVAAAALLGSPLGHDHCAISLSDLLTPWEVIRRRVKAAAEGDFVVTFYNPRSAGRHWQLGEARALLREHRAATTPVGVVTDASRPTQEVHLTTLGDLDPAGVGMLTTVVVGNSQTRVVAGRMVTPRGYA